MASITEVARRAGVAPSIVSRLLNQDPTLRIRPQTRARITQAVEELGYTPNHAGRALRLARTHAIGLLIPEVTNPIFTGIVRGAERAASQAGYFVLLGNADDIRQREGSYTQLVAQGRIDGILLQRSNAIDDETLARIAATRVPTITINSRAEGRQGSVVFDDEAGTRLATEHLIALGHRDIGHFSGPAATDTARRRLQGFAAALGAAGLARRAEWLIEARYDEEGGHDAMARLLAQASLPTAVVVANVMAAVGALTAARRAGVAVPEQLSIVAFHDTWFAEHTSPPLTAVAMPVDDLGREAVGLLIECIKGAPPRDVVVREPPPVLVERASTPAPP